MKKICLIDDGGTIKQLLEVSAMLKPLAVEWWCQFRPTKEIIPHLQELHDSGLRCVAWGVETGSQRLLDLMEKGTKVSDVEEVLKKARETKIRNVTLIMFGFPTETKDEFMETMEFMRRNQKNIDLVSTSTFGLQRGSRIFDDPKAFGVEKINYVKRTILSDKIEYELASGLTQVEAETLKKRHVGELSRINKIPKSINACKEQILNWKGLQQF